MSWLSSDLFCEITFYYAQPPRVCHHPLLPGQPQQIQKLCLKFLSISKSLVSVMYLLLQQGSKESSLKALPLFLNLMCEILRM